MWSANGEETVANSELVGSRWNWWEAAESSWEGLKRMETMGTTLVVSSKQWWEMDGSTLKL
eukprot:11080246-Alexandrium_andersonii.AAC.1